MYSRNILYLYPEEYPTEWKVIKVYHGQNSSRITLQSNQIIGNFPDNNFYFQVSLMVLAISGEPTVSNTAWSSLHLADHIILSDQSFDDVQFADEGPGLNFYPDKKLFLPYFKEAACDNQNPIE